MPQDTSASAQQRFLSLLKRDILKLELAELDFGIYRILNYRRAQILAYLDETLPGRITAWTQALEQADGKSLARSEGDNCYYHLHTFFSRYWDDGDFIPRARRGGTAAYAVPYNGQDTHFHWATKGSHYVKSGELFSRYAYTDAGAQVRFVIERADTEKDNAKGSTKYFFPTAFAAAEEGFDLRWQWRAASDAENKRYKAKGSPTVNGTGQQDIADEGDALPETEGTTLQERVLHAWLSGADFKAAKPPKQVSPVLLASNAKRFVRKNTSDFFVHPQLGEFLRGELDVYLKHEFVQIWDAPDTELPRIRAKFKLVREIALDLITFLDQIERFQATLFEKRKFVLQADYLVQCSWLLREGGAQGKQLVEEASDNAAQAKEWAGWVGDKAKKANGKKLVAAYPHLPLHTVHFDAEFKTRVLACFDDLEAALGGELIHADNYAALRTIEPAYRARVKCIYIDPPYNTGSDGFLYKDDHMTSSWAGMMDERLSAGSVLLDDRGVTFSSIDHNERDTLRTLFNNGYGAANFVGEIVWNNVTDNNPTRIANEHEYLLCYAKDISLLEASWKNSLASVKAALIQVEESLIAEHSKDLEALVRAYADWYREHKSQLGAMEGYKFIDRRGIYAGSRSVHNPGKEGYRYDVIHPQTKEPCKQPLMGYRFPQNTMRQLLDEDRVLFGEDHTKLIELKVYATQYEEKLASVLILDGRSGANDLRHMFAGLVSFKNPKPTALLEHLFPFVLPSRQFILDYFAGSGTSGHAVINLNRADGGARKFLLVEQGEYFDTVTLPRIAKAMTAPEWKEGAPKDTVVHDDAGDPDHWSRRTLPLVRVLRLERYEDSLNALDFAQGQAQAAADRAQGAIDFATNDEAHMLRYWLMDDSAGQPVRLSTSKLTDPFAYQLTLHEPGGERLVGVDLLETARLLLGLAPKRLRELKDKRGRRHQLMEAVLANDLARGVAEPKVALLWLRAVDDARDEKAALAEYQWLAQTVQAQLGRDLKDYSTIFHNRAAFWPAGMQGTSIDSLLAERMMERAH